MAVSQSETIRVLHVDDEPGLCEVVASFLEREHDWLSVVFETDVGSARERIGDEDIDCVVSDYDMPDTDGLTFLKEVREAYPDLPFILYTGKGSEEIASEAISAGVDDYLQKETSTDQYAVLANRIRNVVDRQRAQAAVESSEQRYHNLVDTAPVPIMLFDESADIVYANDIALDLLDAENMAALSDVRMPDLLVPEDRDAALGRFRTVFEDRESVPEMEFQVQTLDGRERRVAVATAPGVYRGVQVAQAVARVIEE